MVSPSMQFSENRTRRLMHLRGMFTLIILMLAFAQCALSAFDTLAVVAGRPITSEDFVNRFELAVYPGKDQGSDLRRLKEKFLASMVAEKLLALDANRGEGDLAAETEILARQTEHVFLRDALFRREVLDHVKVSDAEIRAGVNQASSVNLLDAFYFPDSTRARLFYGKARSLTARDFYPMVDSLHISHDTLEIRYGESTMVIDHALAGKRVGSLTMPTLTDDGYVVFRVLSKQVNNEFNALGPAERAERVRKLIRGRKANETGLRYLLSVMKDVRVDVIYGLFRPLARKIQEQIQNHRPEPNDPHYHLAEPDIASLRNKLEKDLGEQVLEWKGNRITLEEVLDELPLTGFTAADTSLTTVTSALHAALRFIVQNRVLAARARELGLQNSGEVRYNVQSMIDAFAGAKRAESIRSEVRVTPIEVDSFFNKHQDLILRSVKIKVRRYEAASLDEAASMYNQLVAEGELSPARNDTTGVWMFASELGEKGAIVALLNPGELYGPVREGKKYAWYKLIDRQTPVSQEGLEKSLRVANQELLEQKRRRTLNEHIARVADNSNVRIYYDRLQKVNVTLVQMFSVRYIGFGGKIVAVPPVYPREDWIRYLQNKATIFP